MTRAAHAARAYVSNEDDGTVSVPMRPFPPAGAVRNPPTLGTLGGSAPAAAIQGTPAPNRIEVQVSRLQDGTRKILSISEVAGVKDDKVQLQEIFTFEKLSMSPEGKVIGRFRASGVRPKCWERLRAGGIDLPPNMFEGMTEVR